MDWLTTGFSSAYGGGLAADTSEKVGNGLPTNTGTILITERGRLQQSLLSAVKISMKNTSSWNTRQILKSSDSGKSPPKLTHSMKNGRDIMRNVTEKEC